MSRWFNLEEFLTSSTAKQKSIENLPSFEVVEHLSQLAWFLDELRDAWGSGINITSGFRCDKLNKAVGGVTNSCHKYGWAADIQPANGKFDDFKQCVVEFFKGKNFDEVIIENNKKTQWVHVQIYSPNGFQRKKIFSLSV